MRGGPGSEYDISLQTGQTVLTNLPREKYYPIDIYISKNGEWFTGGVEKKPGKIIESVDVIWNALHGEFGEDGGVQAILDAYGIPYTGSDKIASAVAMNKALTKKTLAGLGIKTPPYLFFDLAVTEPLQAAREVFNSFAPPYVVKPVNLGSSVGVEIVKTVSELPAAISSINHLSSKILVEEYIAGREATCGVVDDFRGEKIYSLIPIEIIPPAGRRFYDYHAKYLSDDTGFRLPGAFTKEENEMIKAFAKLAHETLRLRHYSRSDFIVSPRRGIYFLEVNTLPGLTSHSLIPRALQAVGCPLPVFLDHVLTLALRSS